MANAVIDLAVKNRYETLFIDLLIKCLTFWVQVMTKSIHKQKSFIFLLIASLAYIFMKFVFALFLRGPGIETHKKDNCPTLTLI